jgi:hypothetical protein
MRPMRGKSVFCHTFVMTTNMLSALPYAATAHNMAINIPCYFGNFREIQLISVID